MIEEWRVVEGYPDYEISSLGRVRSRAPIGATAGRGGNRTPRILNPGYTGVGYPTVVLCRSGSGKKTHYIHALVASAFIGPRPIGLEVRHLDGDPANCLVGNLAYGTTSENAYDRVRHGTHCQARKTHCKHGHPFDALNTYITPGKGGRRCRTCRAQSRRRHPDAVAA